MGGAIETEVKDGLFSRFLEWASKLFSPRIVEETLIGEAYLGSDAVCCIRVEEEFIEEPEVN